jgi:hypothetical protein
VYLFTSQRDSDLYWYSHSTGECKEIGLGVQNKDSIEMVGDKIYVNASGQVYVVNQMNGSLQQLSVAGPVIEGLELNGVAYVVDNSRRKAWKTDGTLTGTDLAFPLAVESTPTIAGYDIDLWSDFNSVNVLADSQHIYMLDVGVRNNNNAFIWKVKGLLNPRVL